MSVYIIGLVFIVLLVDCHSFKQIKEGIPAVLETNSDDLGWVAWNLVLCIVIGTAFTTIHHYIIGWQELTDSLGNALPTDGSDSLGAFLFIGGLVWCLNMAILCALINTSLEGYIKYKQSCQRLGVDVKDHVNKFFVTTNKTQYGVQEYDGLRADIEVNLQRIRYNKTWLGTYPYMERVTTLVILPEVKLQKEIIGEYVQDYFNARGQYQVDGTELKVLDNKELDVIIVK